MYRDGIVVPYEPPPYVLKEEGWSPIVDRDGIVAAHSYRSPAAPRVGIQRAADAIRGFLQRILGRLA